MSRKKTVLYVLCVLCAVVMIFSVLGAGGCKKSKDVQAEATGVLLEYRGCKQFLAGSQVNDDGFAPGPHRDCIEYQYDGNGTLLLYHISAGFNCCPGEITAVFQFTGSEIIVTEGEKDQGCHCLCLFDVDYEMQNLAPGQYTIRIIEPYTQTSDPLLEFTVDFSAAASGTFCVDRNHYPWL